MYTFFLAFRLTFIFKTLTFRRVDNVNRQSAASKTFLSLLNGAPKSIFTLCPANCPLVRECVSRVRPFVRQIVSPSGFVCVHLCLAVSLRCAFSFSIYF